MRQSGWMILGLSGFVAVSGCRTATRVTEVPRVDLELSGGNRGYLVGTPPEAAQLKTTRQMVETDVEIPSFYKPKRLGAPLNLEGFAPPETETGEQASAGAVTPPTGQPAGPFDTYVVQKGDSLWSIAAKPSIYGKATRWRLIFDANRDVLKSPDRVRPGMSLKIPRGAGGGSSTTYGDDGVTYTK